MTVTSKGMFEGRKGVHTTKGLKMSIKHMFMAVALSSELRFMGLKAKVTLLITITAAKLKNSATIYEAQSVETKQ